MKHRGAAHPFESLLPGSAFLMQSHCLPSTHLLPLFPPTSQSNRLSQPFSHSPPALPTPLSLLPSQSHFLPHPRLPFSLFQRELAKAVGCTELQSQMQQVRCLLCGLSNKGRPVARFKLRVWVWVLGLWLPPECACHAQPRLCGVAVHDELSWTMPVRMPATSITLNRPWVE